MTTQKFRIFISFASSVLFCLFAEAQSWKVSSTFSQGSPLRFDKNTSNSPPQYCLMTPQKLPEELRSDLRVLLKESLAYWSRELSTWNARETLALGQFEWQETTCEDLEKVTLAVSFDPNLESEVKDLFNQLSKPLSISFFKSDKSRSSDHGMIVLNEEWLGKLQAPVNTSKQSSWERNKFKWNLIHEIGYFAGYTGTRWGWESSSFSEKIYKYTDPVPKEVPPLTLGQVDFSSCSQDLCYQIKGPNQEGRISLVRVSEDTSKPITDVAVLKMNLETVPLMSSTQAARKLDSWFWKGPVKIFKSERSKDFSSGFLTVTPFSLFLISAGAKKTSPRVLFDLTSLQALPKERRLASQQRSSQTTPAESGGNEISQSPEQSKDSELKASSEIKPLRGEAKRRAGIYIRERDPKKALKSLSEN